MEVLRDCLAEASRMTRRHSLASACAVLALVAAAPLAAQQPQGGQRPPGAPAESTLTNTEVPWRTSYFPYLVGLSNDGPLLAFRVRYFHAAPYEDRVAVTHAVQFDAGIGWHGSRFASVQYTAPRFARGWRLYALGTAVREARFGFYGIGENATFDPANEANGHDLFYRASRRTYRAQLDVTRRIAGPLHFAVMGELLSSRFSPLDQPGTLFQQTFGNELSEDDASVRGALVLDTRDVEYNPRRGVLLEAGAQLGTGGDGYQRVYGIFRGWLNPHQGTVLAARLVGSQLFGTPSLQARYFVPGWERPVLVLGGGFSHRGLDLVRYVGKGVLLGNFEVRQEDIKTFAQGLVGIGVIGFVDAGRVFEPSDFRLTFDDLKVGGGGGILVRFARSTAFSATLSRGPEHTYFLLSTWSLF